MKLETLPEEFVRALPVLEKINQAGFDAYFVGGSVRDALLNRPIHDVDIATSAYPEEIKQIFPHTVDIGIEHGTVLVLFGKTENEHYEITTFRTESTYTDYRRPDSVDFVRELSEDLKRRDFTINAFAMDKNGEIIDLFDGLSDLTEQRLKAVGKASERFNEDALRIMRGLRFAANLNFEIEAKTLSAMTDLAPLLTKISIERIFIEFEKLLCAPHFRRGIELLLETKAYQYLPFVEEKALKNVLSDLTENFTFDSSELAFAALLVKSDEKNVKKFLKAWKVSNHFMNDVSDLTAAYQEKTWNLENIYRFGLKKAQQIDQLKRAEGLKIDENQAVKFDELLQIHDKSEINCTGKDLMAAGIPAGPQLGQLLKTIEAKIVRNELKNNRNEILTFVKEQK